MKNPTLAGLVLATTLLVFSYSAAVAEDNCSEARDCVKECNDIENCTMYQDCMKNCTALQNATVRVVRINEGVAENDCSELRGCAQECDDIENCTMFQDCIKECIMPQNATMLQNATVKDRINQSAVAAKRERA